MAAVRNDAFDVEESEVASFRQDQLQSDATYSQKLVRESFGELPTTEKEASTFWSSDKAPGVYPVGRN